MKILKSFYAVKQYTPSVSEFRWQVWRADETVDFLNSRRHFKTKRDAAEWIKTQPREVAA